eukprot:TRINITY_DN8917_c0_g1_i1.p1 TRINITY_DN8917_c0_g1~~TRINITY_DN8917_c0_g1_i1.p1  ORF type:complete len:362 (+),score=65.51 TRINITY_DN8917_c0_g1_i1:51-1088(+)
MSVQIKVHIDNDDGSEKLLPPKVLPVVPRATFCGINLKYLALGVLVVQNTSAVLLMRYTRTAAVPSELFDVATTVVYAELMKIVGCLLMMLMEQNFSLAAFKTELHRTLVQDREHVLKLFVPAGLYTLQNNVLFIALENLEATMFQVTYQLKLLLTAVFTVLLLGRSLSKYKWGSLCLLTAGVVLTQLPQKTTPGHAAQKGDWGVGLIACLTSATSSGFASVYFESVLKRKSSSSIWVRNVQLGVSSLPLSLFACYLSSKEGSVSFTKGYNFWVWSLVVIQAGGGVLVAVVIKYADNILKGFSTSLAIIVSGVVSAAIFDFSPSYTFLTGAVLVILSTFTYSVSP